jgi:hypothetical protein
MMVGSILSRSGEDERQCELHAFTLEPVDDAHV